MKRTRAVGSMFRAAAAAVIATTTIAGAAMGAAGVEVPEAPDGVAPGESAPALELLMDEANCADGMQMAQFVYRQHVPGDPTGPETAAAAVSYYASAFTGGSENPHLAEDRLQEEGFTSTGLAVYTLRRNGVPVLAAEVANLGESGWGITRVGACNEAAVEGSP